MMDPLAKEWLVLHVAACAAGGEPVSFHMVQPAWMQEHAPHVELGRAVVLLVEERTPAECSALARALTELAKLRGAFVSAELRALAEAMNDARKRGEDG